MSRDAADFTEASYFDDPSKGCDSLEDHVKELVTPHLKPGTSVKAAEGLFSMVLVVVRTILDEGRASALVDVQKLSGREILARLVSEVIDAPNPRLMACCVDFVFSLGVQVGKNETDIAADADVTKASVSRYCVHLKNTYLAGNPAPGMKSNKAVASYRATRTGRSSRAPATPWALADVLTAHFRKPA